MKNSFKLISAYLTDLAKGLSKAVIDLSIMIAAGLVFMLIIISVIGSVVDFFIRFK
jgi:uncharacterized protein YybS (DUF2232 family)